MVELEWSIGGEDFGRVPCDGLICSTPSGSTAYNLSNGGPVLMWGLDAMALTFVAPHDLRARPFVVPRGTRPPHLEPDARRRLCRSRRRPPRRRCGHGRARGDRARRAAVAPRNAAGGDVRPALPAELRQHLAGAGRGLARSVASGQMCSLRRRSTITAMLRRLRIENLVLIREVELELTAGLNVLSGETGAGKTIFAQAIGLLLGVKGDAGAVGPTASEAYVEAEFDVPDGFFEETWRGGSRGAAAGGRAGARPGAPRVRRRPHPGVRVGASDRARGSRRRVGAADRDVGAIRAASARAARLPARRAGRIRRRGAARAPTPGARSLARADRRATAPRGDRPRCRCGRSPHRGPA